MALDTSRLHVDCSSHNGSPDLRAYWDAGHRHLMLKATEGTGYLWPGMALLAQRWHALGGTCGYYHWLYATKSGLDQYNWFWNNIRPVFRAGDELMVDFEDVDPSRWTDDATHLSVLKDFTTRCAVNAQVCIYTGNWYLSNLPLTREYLKSQMVVMSDYSHDPPRNPYGLTYCAHQFTDRATVAGFANPVDYNRRLITPASVMPAPTPTEDQLSAAEVTELKTYIDSKFADLAGQIVQNIKDIRGGALEQRASDHNLQATEDAIGQRVAWTQQAISQLRTSIDALTAAEAAEPATSTAALDAKLLVSELGAALSRGEAVPSA